MKKSVLLKTVVVAFVAMHSVAAHADWKDNLSPYDQNAPLGWATVGGSVTGGEGGTTVTVKNRTELMNALKGTDKKIIYVEGEFEQCEECTEQDGYWNERLGSRKLKTFVERE